MIKFLKRLIFLVLLFFTAMGMYIFSSSIKVEAAIVGSNLSRPESGWKRINDSDVCISYDSNWVRTSRNGSNIYQNDFHHNNGQIGAVLKFGFYGQKLRLLSWKARDCSGINVNIDGVDYGNYDDYGKTNNGNFLVFETTNLSKGLHEVVVTTLSKEVFSTPSSGNFFALDAIDIDLDGKLQPYAQGISAQGITLNKKVAHITVGGCDSLMAKITPENAVNKKVTWISSDPSIVQVDKSGKITGITEGIATITARTLDGTNLTSSCNVIVRNGFVELDGSSSDFNFGEEFELDLKFDNNDNIKSLGANLSFDSNIISFETAKLSEGIKVTRMRSINDGLIIYLTSKAPLKSGAIVTLKFKAKAPGTTNIVFNNVRVANEKSTQLIDYNNCFGKSITIH